MTFSPSWFCAKETRREITYFLSPLSGRNDHTNSLHYIYPESLNSYRWRHFINTDASKKDIYHMNWKFVDRWMWFTHTSSRWMWVTPRNNRPKNAARWAIRKPEVQMQYRLPLLGFTVSFLFQSVGVRIMECALDLLSFAWIPRGKVHRSGSWSNENKSLSWGFLNSWI